MDTILTAMIAAVSSLSEPAIRDAYNGLKSLLGRKLGAGSPVVDAADKLEKNPNSTGRKETLKEELTSTNLQGDSEVIEAARVLLDTLKQLPNGQQIIQQTVTGNKNIFSATGSITVNQGPS